MSKMSRKKKKLSVDFDNRTYNRMLQYTHHQGMSKGLSIFALRIF